MNGSGSKDTNFCSYNGTQAESNWSTDTHTTDIVKTVGYWINILVVCELSFAICCSIVALRIMLICRKLPDSIRYLSINFLVASLVFVVSNFILSITRLVLGPNNCYYELIFDFRTFLSSVLLLVLWCTICALTIERFIAIRCPYRYATMVTKTTLKIAIIVLWSFNAFVPSVMLYISWLLVCGQYNYNYIFTCDIFAIFNPVKLFMTMILCILYSITIVVYTKILLCIRRHQRAIQALNKSSGTQSKGGSHPFSKMILPIVLSFILLQSPHIVTTIIVVLKPVTQERSFRILFHIIYYLCFTLNNYVTLYLYVWRFPECRMTFYHMFSKIFSGYAEKADALRMEIFSIVTASRSSGTMCTNGNARSQEITHPKNGSFSSF